MNRQEILDAIKFLAPSQGSYKRLYDILSDKSSESEEFLDKLESLNFKDTVDLVMYLEG